MGDLIDLTGAREKTTTKYYVSGWNQREEDSTDA